jgi:hypothetical protein
MIVGLPSCEGGCTELSACLLLPWGVASCRCEGQLLTLDYDMKVSIKLMPLHCLELALYYILVQFSTKLFLTKSVCATRICARVRTCLCICDAYNIWNAKDVGRTKLCHVVRHPGIFPRWESKNKSETPASITSLSAGIWTQYFPLMKRECFTAVSR